jgi:hypothetical protein
MIVHTPPCRSRTCSRPSLKTPAAMKNPTTTETMRSRARIGRMPSFYHDTVSGFRKKD